MIDATLVNDRESFLEVTPPDEFLHGREGSPLTPTPKQEHLMASHAGPPASRYNTDLAHVKEALDNGEPAERSHYGLLRWRNANKDVLAVNSTTGEVWWSQNSKETYSMSLYDLARSSSN